MFQTNQNQHVLVCLGSPSWINDLEVPLNLTNVEFSGTLGKIIFKKCQGHCVFFIYKSFHIFGCQYILGREKAMKLSLMLCTFKQELSHLSVYMYGLCSSRGFRPVHIGSREPGRKQISIHVF